MNKLPWLALLALLGLAAAFSWRPAASAPSASCPTPPRGFGESLAPLLGLARPPLDLQPPVRVETATFALG